MTYLSALENVCRARLAWFLAEGGGFLADGGG